LISGNANQIQQVLINLMINAQQAMQGNSGEVRVTTTNQNSGMIQVCVSDTGPGIPEALKAKIFEPFFTTKEVGKGTGLGLSVSYGIIKEHNGKISVESSPDKGTEFRISLPMAKLKVACPTCGQKYNIKRDYVGQATNCKKCGNNFKIDDSA
jgi:signal transduction histidine kinase